MYLDLEDYRPDTPRVPQAISLREGVLVSLLVHALLVIAYLVMPEAVPQEASAVVPAPERESVEFVHMVPRVERQAPPRSQPQFSDLDRRAATTERPPNPSNQAPFSAGNTSEKVVGGREEKPPGPEAATVAPPNSSATVDLASKLTPNPPVAPAPPAGGALGSSLRNLAKYLQDQNFDNQQGGLGEQLPEIQFDSKGIEFGPWLRRFVAQVKRNWYVPQMAMAVPGKVVIQFYVHRDGRLTDITVVAPSVHEPYTRAAFNALRASNPTLQLPDGYPDEKALFTVTFFYEVRLELDGSPCPS
jgi:TonB family protein